MAISLWYRPEPCATRISVVSLTARGINMVIIDCIEQKFDYCRDWHYSLIRFE